MKVMKRSWLSFRIDFQFVFQLFKSSLRFCELSETELIITRYCKIMREVCEGRKTPNIKEIHRNWSIWFFNRIIERDCERSEG